MEQHVGQLVLEDLGIGIGPEVAVLAPGLDVGENDPVDELLEAPLALLRPEGAAEVLRRDDGGGVHAPEIRVLGPALLEDDLAALPVCLDDIAALPVHAFIRVLPGSRVEPLDDKAGLAEGVVDE